MPKFKITQGIVKLDKELNDIDRFVLEVVTILSAYVDYVIVSGYVAILFGRARGSEDVDLFIQEMDQEQFRKMHRVFCSNGFDWNSSNPDELYAEYLKTGIPVGVWKKDFPLLRVDMKFPKDASQRLLFADRFKAVISGKALWIASIESTIAYKQQIAKSDKDVLDAKHLLLVFDEIDQGKIERYKKLFQQEFHHAR